MKLGGTYAMGTDGLEAIASGGGWLLGLATRVTAALRRAEKPLHPRGVVAPATLRRIGGGESGASFIDDVGTDPAEVRVSRALGLPRGWPDVLGLAVRVENQQGASADLLFASTGWSPLGRCLLRPARDPRRSFFSTLLPYRSIRGPIYFGALPEGERAWVLLWAAGRRDPWTPFARLSQGEAVGDRLIAFDPVLNPVPGLTQYAVVQRLRQPAYRRARDSRGYRAGGRRGVERGVREGT